MVDTIDFDMLSVSSVGLPLSFYRLEVLLTSLRFFARQMVEEESSQTTAECLTGFITHYSPDRAHFPGFRALHKMAFRLTD